MNPGGRPSKNQSIDTTSLPKTLDELGITRDQSSKWQKMADIPEEASIDTTLIKPTLDKEGASK